MRKRSPQHAQSSRQRIRSALGGNTIFRHAWIPDREQSFRPLGTHSSFHFLQPPHWSSLTYPHRCHLELSRGSWHASWEKSGSCVGCCLVQRLGRWVGGGLHSADSVDEGWKIVGLGTTLEVWRLSTSKFATLGTGRFIIIGQMLRQWGNCRAALRMCTAMSSTGIIDSFWQAIMFSG